MTDSTADDFFTAKHARQTWIIAIANIAAWVVLIVNILLVGARFIEVQNSYLMQWKNFGEPADFFTMLSNNPLYTASILVDLLSIFLRGVVYWLILKGISLGLSMIVETDLNVKEKSQGGYHDQRPEQANLQ